MAVDIFMTLVPATSSPFLPKDFYGETQDAEYKTLNAVEIQDVSWGIENKQTIGSATTGAGTGKAAFQEVVITKAVDKLSTKLLQFAGAGAHFSTVTLYFRKAGDGVGKPYYMVTLRLVFVNKLERSASGGENSLQETVTFAVGSIGEQYIQQLPTGGTLPAISGGWNQVKNTTNVTDIPG